MAAAANLAFSSSYLLSKTRSTHRLIASFLPSSLRFPYPKVSCFFIAPKAFASPVLDSICKPRVSRIQAVTEELVSVATAGGEENSENGSSPQELKARLRSCKLYICNLPRSCDIAELLEMFKPFGTVQSVEVSRNAETGISRGCGYVTMSSINEGRAARSALDGSDVSGREMRVMFLADVNSRRKNIESLNSAPESPHKVYVGNLAWSVRSENLRELFSKFGTVVSARVLFDRKAGRNRVYGFVSFSTEAELVPAISLNGTEFHGRRLLVAEVLKKSEP